MGPSVNNRSSSGIEAVRVDGTQALKEISQHSIINRASSFPTRVVNKANVDEFSMELNGLTKE